MIMFVEYPPCSTCQKAKRWLRDYGFDIVSRHIVNDTPNANELALWIQKSGLPVERFFNTSGKLYREMGLKERLRSMDDAAKIELLASDGMLIKRPLLIKDDTVLVGFNEQSYKATLL